MQSLSLPAEFSGIQEGNPFSTVQDSHFVAKCPVPHSLKNYKNFRWNCNTALDHNMSAALSSVAHMNCH